MVTTGREPLVLYSTNSWLAYIIAEEYYNGEHYVWCTPHFDASSIPSINYSVPPSSSPASIYKNLSADVSSGDLHSRNIEANKAGILKGAALKRTAGVVNSDQASDIASIAQAATTADFYPLIFVIPYGSVDDLITNVPVGQRAHPLAPEFIIDHLPRDRFDVIQLNGSSP